MAMGNCAPLAGVRLSCAWAALRRKAGSAEKIFAPNMVSKSNSQMYTACAGFSYDDVDFTFQEFT